MNRPIPARRTGVALCGLLWGLGTIVAPPARADGDEAHDRSERSSMQAKIAVSLRETYSFDPNAERAELLDEDGVVMMEPLVVQENPLPRKLEVAVEQERAKLTPTFDFQKGGEFVKDAFGRMTVEAKPYQDLIKRDIRVDHAFPRWSLLRIKW